MAFTHSKLIAFLFLLVLLIIYFRAGLHTAYVIASLPVVWQRTSSQFLISQDRDNFDVTFANYSAEQQTSSPAYPDLVPPVLHQIVLGKKGPKPEWQEARNNCIKYHSDWETHFWTDENAGKFVAEKFPHLKEMWDGYKYPIQRVDALRYMVLYEYGGVVLDMDLDCRRSLGPLRRFSFVSPAAQPVGFSNGMMMAEKKHPFVLELLRNLPIFDRNWFFLPYATVMFSTGCHYASAIHAIQKDRSNLRILSGEVLGNKDMHRLNGNAVTPLFHHLGASSWHSFDAAIIVGIGKLNSSMGRCNIGFILGVVVFSVSVWAAVLRLRVWRARRKMHRARVPSEDVTRISVFGFKRA